MKNKKGVSEIVAYVLLIIIAMTISGLVYAWLSTLVPKCKLECPDDIGITLDEYNCYVDEGTKYFNITVRMTGFSEVDGLNVKIGNRSNGGAVYTFKGRGPGGGQINQNGSFYFTSPLGQDDRITIAFNYSKYNLIKKVQITPVYYSTLCEEEKLRYTLCDKSKLLQDIQGQGCDNP